ncbi:MAG: ribosomal protein S18-alanine N-acetyltransferase [Thermoleophilia bacterium]
MSQGHLIRFMTLADVPRVAALEQRLFTQPWTPAVFVAQVQRESGIYLVCEVDAVLAGYLIADAFIDVWHIMNVAVDAPYRRHHLASDLLEAYFSLTEQEPHRGHTLEVRVSNQAAIDLYRSFGFISSGVRPNYYSNDREDALIMWREWEGESA